MYLQCITQPHAHFHVHVYNIMCDIALSCRTRMERENQDLALEQIRLKAAEQRVTVLESIKWVILLYIAVFALNPFQGFSRKFLKGGRLMKSMLCMNMSQYWMYELLWKLVDVVPNMVVVGYCCFFFVVCTAYSTDQLKGKHYLWVSRILPAVDYFPTRGYNACACVRPAPACTHACRSSRENAINVWAWSSWLKARS